MFWFTTPFGLESQTAFWPFWLLAWIPCSFLLIAGRIISSATRMLFQFPWP